MEQHNNKEGIDELMEIARLRFGMIVPVIQETYPDESIMAYCRRVSKVSMQLPDGRTVHYSQKQSGNGFLCIGMEGLMPWHQRDVPILETQEY